MKFSQCGLGIDIVVDSERPVQSVVMSNAKTLCIRIRENHFN